VLKHHDVKIVWESESKISHILNLALSGGE